MEEQLFQACKDGNVEEVIKLLQNTQLNTNWHNSRSRTAFWIACENGHIEIAKLLLNDNRVDINKANSFGATPFFIACKNGQIEIVKLLLKDNRVDINKASRETPFWIACYKGHIEIVKYLLVCGREIDINKENNDGKTGLEIAREMGNKKKKEWESEEGFENMKRKYTKIVELIESFERNQNETRTKLRMELRLAGKFIDLFISISLLNKFINLYW